MTARSLEVVLGWGVAAVAVLTIALDQTAILWTAGAPWVPSVYQSLSVGTSEVGLAAILLYVLIIPSPRHSRPFTVAAKAILASGAVLVVFLSISAIGSIAPRLSLARTGDVILGLLAFATVARRPDLGRWLTIGIAGVTLLEMPFVILQEVKQSTFPVGAFLNQQAIELPSTASGAAVVFGPDGQRWQRAMGTFPHPNVLGGFLALSLVLTLTGIRCSDRAQRYAVVVWILGWLELVFTFSRTALLAVTVACSLWAISRLRARKSRPAVAFLLVPPCLALAIGLTVAGPYIVPRLDPSPAQLTTTPAVVRISLVHVAIAMVKMHPLLGSGAGTFSLAELAPPFDASDVEPVHVVPLLVASEAGIPAGLAWLGLILAGPVAEWREARHLDAAILDRLLVPAALLTIALLDHYFWTLGPGRSMFWLSIGIWASQESRPRFRPGASAISKPGELPRMTVLIAQPNSTTGASTNGAHG